MPMMALVNPIYDCLFRLAQPDSLNKEEEVGDPFGQLWRGGQSQMPVVHGGSREHHFLG